MRRGRERSGGGTLTKNDDDREEEKKKKERKHQNFARGDLTVYVVVHTTTRNSTRVREFYRGWMEIKTSRSHQKKKNRKIHQKNPNNQHHHFSSMIICAFLMEKK